MTRFFTSWRESAVFILECADALSRVIFASVFAILNFKLEFSNAFVANILSALGNASFLCVLGSRMLFNLKEAGERGQNEGTSYNATSRTVSGMEFAEPGPQNSEGEIPLLFEIRSASDQVIEHELDEVSGGGDEAQQTV